MAGVFCWEQDMRKYQWVFRQHTVNRLRWGIRIVVFAAPGLLIFPLLARAFSPVRPVFVSNVHTAFFLLLILLGSAALYAVVQRLRNKTRAHAGGSLTDGRFQVLYRESLVGMGVLRSDGGILEVNEACRETFSFLRGDEWKGSLFEILSLSAHHKDMLRRGECVRTETVMHPDTRNQVMHPGDLQENRYINVMIAPVSSDKHFPGGFLFQVQDMTVQRRAEDAMRALVSSVIGSIGQDFYDRTVRVICELLDVNGALIGELVGENEIHTLAMVYDGKSIRDYSYRIEGAPCAAVIKEGVRIITEGVQDLFPEDRDLKAYGINGYAGFPLRDKNDKPLGVVCALTRNKLSITPQVSEVLEIIAAKASVEIERTRAEEAMRKSNREMTIRNRISEIFLTASDEEMYEQVLNVILEATGSRHGVFGYIDSRGDWVCPSLTREIWDECRMPDKKTVFARDKWTGIWREALHLKQTVIDNRDFRVPMGHIPVMRAMDVPIIYQGNLVGNVLIGNRDTDYTAEDSALLETIADNIAPILFVKLERDREEQERVKAESELKKSIENFRRTFDESPIASAIVALDMQLERVNTEFCRITGYSEEELLALTIPEITHPDDLEQDTRLSERLLTGEIDSCQTDKRLIRKDGGMVWVRLSLRLIRDSEGKPLHYLPMMEDITARKRAEEELTKFKKGIEQSEDVMFITNPVGKIVYVNPAFRKVYGYSDSEVIGRTPRILKSGHHSRELYGDFWNRLVSGESVHGEFVNRTRDGRFVIMEASANPILDENGRMLGFLAIQREITMRKQTEEELRAAKQAAEAANVAKSAFLATMSHELRTPLNGILGMAQLLEELFYGDLSKEQHKFTRSILDSGRHLLNLINEILDLSKIESGKIQYTREDFSPLSIIHDTVMLLNPRIAEKNIAITIAVDRDIVIWNDERRFKQVILNLFENAIKFTDQGGKIDISTQWAPDEESVRFVVRDTGIGIKEEDFGKIFQYFQQLDSTYSRKGEGTGLGLALSKRLVEGMGGEMWFTSVYGEGSTFVFSLPAERDKSPDTIRQSGDTVYRHNTEETPESQSMEKVLLLIEDNPLNAQVVINLLEANRYSVVHFDNAALAIEYARNHRPDLILMDIQLPEMDGITATKILKGDGRTASIPVFALTAHAMEEDAQAAFRSGIERYITKPIDSREFLGMLKEFFSADKQ